MNTQTVTGRDGKEETTFEGKERAMTMIGKVKAILTGCLSWTESSI